MTNWIIENCKPHWVVKITTQEHGTCNAISVLKFSKSRVKIIYCQYYNNNNNNHHALVPKDILLKDWGKKKKKEEEEEEEEEEERRKNTL